MRPIVSVTITSMGLDSGTSTKSPRYDAGNFGCFFFVGIICFGVAIFSIVGVARNLTGHHNSQAKAAAISAGIAGLIGAAMILLWRKFLATYRLEKQLRVDHPVEPWMWNRQWINGTIVDHSGVATGSMWGFAIFWNIFATPAGIMGFRDAMLHHQSMGWIALIFPVAGIGLLISALTQTRRRHAFGNSFLKLTTFPGQVGGQLSGVISASDQLLAATVGAQPIEITLTCSRRTRSRGAGESSTTINVLWQDSQSIPVVNKIDEPGRVGIPISFQIPADATPTTPPGLSTQSSVYWQLQARASLPGPDYVSQFDVPVFSVAGAVAAPENPSIAEQPVTSQKSHPDDPRIRVQRDAGGGLRIDFPAGRNLGGIVAAFVFAVLSGVLGYVSFSASVPNLLFYFPFHIVFPFLAGAVALGTIICGVVSLFKSKWIFLKNGNVQIGWSMFGMNGQRDLAIAGIQKIETDIGSSSTVGSRTTTYWEVKLTVDGPPITVARGMSKSDAEWTADQIRKLQGDRNSF